MRIAFRGQLRILGSLVLASTTWNCRSAGTGSAQAPSVAPTRVDTLQAMNDRMAQRVLARIAGREKMPAESVFANIRLPQLKRTSAATFLDIMSYGYARGLGVSCSHCHVVTDFASDEKRPKRAAREMAMMHTEINQRLLRMENLATQPPEERFINCATCHRGAVKPPPYRGP